MQLGNPRRIVRESSVCESLQYISARYGIHFATIFTSTFGVRLGTDDNLGRPVSPSRVIRIARALGAFHAPFDEFNKRRSPYPESTGESTGELW